MFSLSFKPFQIVARKDSRVAKAALAIAKRFPWLTVEAARVEYDTTTFVKIMKSPPIKVAVQPVALIVLCELGVPYPEHDLVVRDFGKETIVVGDRRYGGHVLHLCGEVTRIRNWIASAGGMVWVTQNPLCGSWYLKTLTAQGI